jgi:hypothetical protein
MAAIGLVAKAIRPYREAGLQASQLAATQRQVAALDAENVALRRRVALLNTTGGIVTEARKMGYLKPGEIPFVVENFSSSSKADAPSALTPTPSVPASPTPRSPFQRLLHRLRGHG